MEAILPFKIKNEQKFFESALKVGYNEMEIYKFIYVLQQSDLDIFPKMQDERINMMIYGWELCEDYKQKLNPDEWELPEEMEMILKYLVPWSMDIWFSKEWDKCKLHLKIALIHCLNRARDLLMRMPDMMQINWDFLLLYNLKPWNVLYLKSLTVTREKTLENGAQSIETMELPATEEDISYVKLEQLPLIVLRLIKIFDQSSIDMVKTLCIRVIAAWNKIHQKELETSGSRRPYIPPEDKRCLLLICHIYLMAVYEADDVKGYVIDNMINNIRFYYQGFQNSTALYVMDNLEYTPARFIALTNIHLRVQKRDFFDFFIWNKYDTSLVNLFGVVSQAYKSYLLGNLLMELNNMNEDDFASNIPLYKRLMNSYVNEREKSELFLLNELEKLENQRYAHNIIQTVKHVTDFKSKICKGNRMSNIGNYENSDDAVTPLDDAYNEIKVENIKEEEVKDQVVMGEEGDDDEQERVRIKESALRLDPIFQNLPNNESILYYVYDVLAKKDYKGWHFAKVVLLVKIIDHELNMIETWRYHPGLTTDFMLNLEVKLSHHYVDLAKIFKDHPFIEQEFWLTAFYLNPTSELYETIKRLGMRNNRKRTEEQTKLVMTIDNIEAKYGLLSSTIDVKEIASLANTDDPDTDYNPLYSALHSLRVPDSLVKDMITAIFLPRNKSFAWVVDWNVLRTRCKMIMSSSKEKKRFVELNMAEANERLKYLIIDYEKYKNRPQLDYGTIEEGYENLMTSGDFDKDSDEEEEEEEEEEDFEDDEDVYESRRRGRGSLAAAARKKEEEKVQDDNSQEDDPFLMGKRRTRARTAATLASFLFQTLPRASRRKRNQKPIEDETKADDDKTSANNDDKSSDSKSPITTSESPIPSPLNADNSDQKDSQDSIVPTRNIKECLKERPQFLNSTQGFLNFIDIWNVEKSDLQTIDENCVSLMESSAVLQRAVKWKLLNKEINPMGCDEQEYIDDTELVIHNAEFAIKMEYNFNAVKVEEQEEKHEVVEGIRNEEPVTAMEVDDDEANVATDKGDKGVTTKEAVESESTLMEESVVEGVNATAEIEQNQDVDFFPSEDTITTEKAVESESTSMEESVVEAVTESAEIEQNQEVSFFPSEETVTTKEAVESESILMEESIVEAVTESAEIEKNQEVNFFPPEDTVTTKKALESESSLMEESVAEAVTESAEIQQNQEVSFFPSEDTVTTKKTVQSESTLMEESVVEGVNESAEIEQNQEVSFFPSEDTVTTKKAVESESTLMEQSVVEGVNETAEIEQNQDVNFFPSEDTITTEKAVESESTLMEESVVEGVNESAEIEPNQEIPPTEESSNESNNSEVSTAALKDSGEVSESNTEINSKRKSINNDEMETEKNLQNEDSNEIQSKTTTEQKESTESEKEKSYKEQLGTIETHRESKDKRENKDIVEEQDISENLTEENKLQDKCSTDTQLKTAEENKKENLEEIESNKENDVEENKDLTKEEIIDDLEENDSDKLKTFDKETSKENPTKSSENENLKLKEIQEKSAEEKETPDKTTNNVKGENDSEENLLDKDKSFENETNTPDTSEANTKSQNNLEIDNKEKQTESEKTEYKQNKETLENQTDLKTFTGEEKKYVLEDVNKTNQDDLDNSKASEYNDKTSDSQSLENDSNIVLHYSSSEELDAAKSTTDKTPAESSCCKKDSQTSVVMDENTTDSIKTQESTDSQTRNLKNLCLTKNLKVLVRKLQPADLTNLRQPKVKIQRVHYEKYLEEFRSKRRRVAGRVYLDIDDSSNSTNSYGSNSSSSDAYRPLRVKRKIPIRRHSMRHTRTSESDNDSNNSDDFKLSTIMTKVRERRLSTPTSQSSQHVGRSKSSRQIAGPKSMRQTSGPKSSKPNLVVTPRSASGLKLRISNAEQGTDVKGKKSSAPIVYEEIIQLSSSSSDACIVNDLSTIVEEVIEVDEHPLFEEEIII